MTQSAAIGIVLNTEDLVDNNRLHELRPDARIEFIEDVHQQQAAEMFAELRWPGDPSPESGVDVRSLELDPADLVMLDILWRSDVMANLAAWGGGTALGDDTYGRVTVSAAVGVISVVGWSLTDYARGGSAVESVQYNLRKPADTEANESQVLVLRFVAHRDHR